MVLSSLPGLGPPSQSLPSTSNIIIFGPPSATTATWCLPGEFIRALHDGSVRQLASTPAVSCIFSSTVPFGNAARSTPAVPLRASNKGTAAGAPREGAPAAGLTHASSVNPYLSLCC